MVGLSFEKEFPELKMRAFHVDDQFDLEHLNEKEGILPFVMAEAIEEYCLDKERVRDVLMKWLKPVGTTHDDVKQIFEELGL